MLRSFIDRVARIFSLCSGGFWTCVDYARDTRRGRIIFWSSFLGLVLVFVLWKTAMSAPIGFQTNTIIKVNKGAAVGEVARELATLDIIRSPLMFKIMLVLTHGQKGLIAGDYIFHEPKSVFGVARAMGTGAYGLELRRVTIPEGMSSTEISKVLAASLTDFDAERFVSLAKPLEGYLFPDTYFLYEDADPELVIETMHNNFKTHLEELSPQIAKFGRPIDQVITMASILEKEARLSETRRTIAGILWKRLDKRMPLQVDAVFVYLLGKSGLALTSADLATDSPYNTYTNKGLPPGPIANPGVSAILDAINPIKTSYYFYLSDSDGVTHYATTFAEHKANISRYLR